MKNKKTVAYLILIIFLLVTIPVNLLYAKTYREAWNYILERIDQTAWEWETRGKFPLTANNFTGKWKYSKSDWTTGFWVGMLWLAYDVTKDARYKNYADNWTAWNFGRETGDQHDRGFVYYYSSAYGYEMTGNVIYHDSAIKAADQLVDMYIPDVELIPVTKKSFDTIIDTMMNLQLLWWAYEKTSNIVYYSTAFKHSVKTSKWLIRKDFSTWQSVHYRPPIFEVTKKHTHQGYNDESCWSRGQSWGFYGYVAAYEKTGHPDFLNVAEGLGDYIIEHLPPDNVPWYDYNDPDPKYKDTSAGAIASAAFFRLSKIEPDSKKAIKYQQTGEKILQSLIDNHLSPTDVNDNSPRGILRHGCYTKPSDEELIFGDYYLMESLKRAMELSATTQKP